MTGILAEKMYSQLERENVLLSEQNGCHRVVHLNQLFIDKTVLKNCKRRHTSLAVTWIDYKKAYHWVKKVQIQSFFWSVSSCIRNYLE